MYEEMRKFFIIYEEVLVIYDFSHDHSKFPYIWGKFYFLFFICAPEHPPELTPLTDTDPQMIICRGPFEDD